MVVYQMGGMKMVVQLGGMAVVVMGRMVVRMGGMVVVVKGSDGVSTPMFPVPPRLPVSPSMQQWSMHGHKQPVQ